VRTAVGSLALAAVTATVAAAAARTLGRTFEDLAQETVFGPVGIRSTAYSRRG
jgi:CubicO group peptidase (beta-lactamase class C family)